MITADQFVGPAASALVASAVGLLGIRVAVAKLEESNKGIVQLFQQWTKSHESLVNERHHENQRRLTELEAAQRDSTRSDMREATRQMLAVSAALTHFKEGA
jgi:DNA repair photolyase